MTIADSSLYYANTPKEDVYADSAYTYFLFLPGQQLLWFLSNTPPQQQDIAAITGLVAGPEFYQLKGDTLSFMHLFFGGKGGRSGEDHFDCIVTAEGIKAVLFESVGGLRVSDFMYFDFKRFRKGE